MSHINDPIIQTILSKRRLTEPVSEADDLERQAKMYHMLVHSKLYRKLSIERANIIWKEEASKKNESGSSKSSSSDECRSLNSNSASNSSSRKKITFSDVLEFIPPEASSPESSSKLMKRMKALFRIKL
jgi:hypothetical protein